MCEKLSTHYCNCSRLFFTVAYVTSINKIKNKINEEPFVPKPSPPFSVLFVRRSPNVAPKGRVSTNAIQNKNILEIFVKYTATTMSASKPPINSAPPAKPKPELSDKKSPNAVPNVFENKIAVQ